MADVFQFGFNDSRSRCTSVDSGDLARRKGDSEDFGESLPNSGTRKTTDKAGRGEYIFGILKFFSFQFETLKLSILKL